ncbi:MAG: 16S rRNA (cytidine(1402)-2'-O)-methyltransferase [Chitinophagales bacterium]|nr:16S rRNA (cytidine(1402)-2'-O)-methyltransferase [Bacteroidota bacterium]MCB9044297.1 16S rRNA (cytidine(1402)-2'-O)-methyltransferase [Chitinophagales bacterium]
MLYVVPTPIGNLQDISFRALEVLKSVDVILAEDTRTSGHLLKHFAIQKPLRAHHAHNEHQSIEKIIAEMKTGTTFALISDAGTPAISDPGFLIVRAAIQANVKVQCLPGAVAFIPALVMSGLPCDRFVFEGFLPHKKGRHTRLQNLQNETRTIIFYESPYRVAKLLEEVCTYFGTERLVSVSREISKIYEETLRGTAQEVLTHFENTAPKGEFVIIVAGNNTKIE